MRQVVRIKSWEQMEKEYGLNSIDNIKCECMFTKEMKYLCNTVIIIENRKTINGRKWNISNHMIAEYLNPEDYPELFI
jgi:hypothetical protein